MRYSRSSAVFPGADIGYNPFNEHALNAITGGTTMAFTFRTMSAALALTAVVAAAPGARADSVSDFYKGKTVRVIIGYGEDRAVRCQH